MLELRNEHIAVTVLPDKGADIYALTDRRTGVDVLFKSPWGLRSPGRWAPAASTMEHWVQAYAGGWQLLLPNGGDECTEQGVTWGYHGEAALVPWQVLAAGETAAELETTLFTVPLRVRRELVLDGPVLRLTETVTNESPDEVEVMWVHHPAFGAPFLEQGCLLSAGCRTVLADGQAPGTLLAPGSRHPWPDAVTASGEPLDLRTIPGPDQPRSVLAYLEDFTSGYFAITNPRLRLGAGLRWPLGTFPRAWLWQEVCAGPGWPWYRRAYAVAVEPATTIPGHGMSTARSQGYAGTRLPGGHSRQVVLEAVLFEASGPVADIAEGGRVELA